jgi:hypothetical protein
MTTARKAILASLFALAAGVPPAGAQFSPATSAPWKRVVVPCGATPNFDLSKGTAFQITLCASASATTISNATRADGKQISILVCQDSVGSRPYAWPSQIFGTADISPLPGHCTAQSFLVAGTQLWATSTGAQQSNVPVPSILKPPLQGGTTFPSSTLALANESGGVAFTSPSDSAGFQRGFGKNRTGGTTNAVTVTSGYVTQSSGTSNMFGIVNSRANNGGNDFETCGYEGTGTGGTFAHRIWNYSPVSLKNTWGTASAAGLSFTDSNHQFFVRYTQTGVSGGTAKCEVSTDFGATWIDLGTRPADFFGSFTQAYWAVGGIYNVAAGTTYHLTSITVTEN